MPDHAVHFIFSRKLPYQASTKTQAFAATYFFYDRSIKPALCMTKRPFDTDKRFKRMILSQTTASIEISSINRELTLE